jgi:hypothetical protein
VTILTPCSKGVIDKLAVVQKAKNFLAFCGTEKLITVFTRSGP